MLRYNAIVIIMLLRSTTSLAFTSSFLRTIATANKPTFLSMTASSYKTPDTLDTNPKKSLVAPGQCQFGTDPIAVKLLERTKVSPTSSLLRFGLPDSQKPLGLSTCACVLAKVKNSKITNDSDGDDEEATIRPYTPCSTNESVGHFDLLVKDYGDKSHISNYMCSIMNVGDEVEFLHNGEKNVKIQASDFLKDYDHILMLTGGTGLTPMIQALHAILGDTESDKPKVTMLYGSKSSDDILGRSLLEKWAKDYPQKFNLKMILSEEPDDSDWDGPRGYIDKQIVQDNFPSADNDRLQVFVCGPPPLYDALCGPREEAGQIKGLLGELNYKPSQVFKF